MILPRSRCRLRSFTAKLLLGAALIFAGCTTPQEVARLVQETNVAMLSSQLGGLAQTNEASPGPSAQQGNEQIEAFIAAHPDQLALTAPLRIRQAMLYLATKKPNLARAAFDSVAKENLHTERDQALTRNADTLIWWFSNSTTDTWSDQDRNAARKALLDLEKEQQVLKGSPDIRDYLAEMRAWIGLTAVRQAPDIDKMRADLENTLNVYADSFEAAELLNFENAVAPLPELKALTSAARRRVRAGIVLAQARTLNRTEQLGAQPKNPTCNRLLNQ